MKKIDEATKVQQEPDLSQLPQTRPLPSTHAPVQSPQQSDTQTTQEPDFSQLPQTQPLPNTPVPATPPQQTPTPPVQPSVSQAIEPQPTTKAEPQPIQAAKIDPAQWEVVIIDDEPDNVGVAKLILEFNKASVRSADSGASGLEMLRQTLPTFLLLDIQMPKMSGWDVLKVIREDAAMKNLPVIALTAHAMVGDKERILEGGFDGYISKPVSPVTFIEQIKDVLGSRPSA